MPSPTRCAIAVAMTCVFASACGSTGSAVAAGASTHTYAAAGASFERAVRAKDLDALSALFARDIVLRSPVLDAPFVGRPRVIRLFRVLRETFRDIRVTGRYAHGVRFVLTFSARVGDARIEIVDLLRFDRAGRITVFTVAGRPLSGVQALAGAVAPHLAEIG